MTIKIRILDYEGDGIKHVNGIQTLSFLIAGSPDINKQYKIPLLHFDCRACRGRMVVGFTTIYAISPYHR